MYSITRRGTPKGTALLAVLQAILLLSALVLSPAAVVAQDGDQASGQAPQVEAGAATDPAPAEPAQKVRIYPKVTKLFPGGKKVVSAWHCPADIGASFGPDKEPGTGDDDCTAVRAKWSLEQDDVASLSNVFGYKTRVTLRNGSDTEVFAEVGDKTGKGRIVAKDKPAKVRPQAKQSGPKATTPEAPVIVPVPEEPADDCSVDPLTGECLPEEPGTEPEPTAEPAPDEPGVDPTPEPAPEEPGTEPEPTAKPAPDPKDECDIDPLTGDCVGEAPVAEPAPEAEPTAAPKASDGVSLAADDGTLRILKGGYRGGSNDINGLAGARFDIWEDDGDNRFEPGGDDDFVRQSGATNSNGAVNESLQPGRYWVREATAPADWNKILQMAYGSGSNSDQDDNAYVDRYQVSSNSTTSTDRYVNRLDNNSYPDVCGLKVALVFDRSGSISDSTEYPKMKNAAKDFVDALKGTPSQFRVYSFSWSATTDSSWTSVADNAGASAVKSVIDGLPPTDGGTNWDAAFREVAGDGAEVIVFLTDGNPTTYGDSQPFEGSTVHLIDVELGVASANNAKNGNAKPKVVAVGIGNAVANPTNLKLISGPNVNDDYYIANFDNLKDKLQQIASKLCGGTVTVLKEIPDGSGGWMADSGWTFSAASSGAAPTPTSGDTNGQGVINFKYDLSVAPYTVTATVTETPEPGWELVKQGGKNAVCRDNGDTLGSNAGDYGMTFTLGIEDIVTCTFRNQLTEAKLTLIKQVDNDYGGTAGPNDFGISVAGTPVTSGVANTYAANQALAIDETGLSGYEFVEITGDGACPAALGGTVTLQPGDDVTCTIVNADIAPKLTLVKRVNNNNGGDAQPDDFGISVDGSVVTSGQANTYTANQALAIDETGLSGYEFVEITGDGACPAALGGTVTLQPGDDVTCTIVNQDIGPKLTLIKQVDNDYGGTAGPNDFGISVAGTPVTSGVANTYAANQALAIDETGLSGYEFVEITGDGACPAALGGTVTLQPGDDVTCTIVNADIAPKLTLVKRVNNNNGGDAQPDDFGISVDGSVVTSGQANTYTANDPLAIDETGLSGYEFVEITGDGACPAALGGTVTLQPGDDVTCTIVNADQPSTITLIKEVVGGPASAADFDAYIGGQQVTWGVATARAPGSYVASEVMNVPDYVAGAWSGACDAQGNVELALGENLTCRITNFHAALRIVKSADPSFYAEVGDVISYTITGTNIGQTTLTGVVVSDNFPGGLDSWNCSLDEPATLAIGEDIVCTATHTIVQADLNAGQVFNQACIDSNQTADEVCDDETVRRSRLTIVKEADRDYYSAVGDVINYTITATNAGQTALTNVDITDNLMADLDDWVCRVNGGVVGNPVPSLASGDAIVCTASYTIVAADMAVPPGTVFNQACADSVETPEVCDDVETPVAKLEIVKEASTDQYAEAGERVTYTITATNTGVADLTDVDITDSLIEGLKPWACTIGNTDVTLPVDRLLSGASIVCSATYTTTRADVERGTVFNQACVDSDETPQDCDDVTIDRIAVDLIKDVDASQLPWPGGTFGYTLTVHNLSVVPVEITSLTDTNSGVAADFSGCTALIGTSLAANDGVLGGADTASCTYTVDRFGDGTYPNVADVIVTDDDQRTATDQDDATVVVPPRNPEPIDIDITKTPDQNKVKSGTAVIFTLVFDHQTEAPPIYLYELTDNVYGDLLDAGNTKVTDNSCLGLYGTLLLPSTEYSCQFTGVVKGTVDDPHVNKATITVTDVDPLNPVPVEPRFASATDKAKVKIKGGGGSGGGGGQPPTDMLPVSDSIAAVTAEESGSPLDGAMSWAIWLLLSTLLIFSTGWVIRRERFAQVTNR